MNSGARRFARARFWVIGGLCLTVTAGVATVLTLQLQSGPVAKSAVAPGQTLRLMPGKANTLQLSAQLINSLGVRTVQVQSAALHERLTLSGVLDVDPNRMVRVHSRFTGEVVSIGANVVDEAGGKPAESRPLRP